MYVGSYIRGEGPLLYDNPYHSDICTGTSIVFCPQDRQSPVVALSGPEVVEPICHFVVPIGAQESGFGILREPILMLASITS